MAPPTTLVLDIETVPDRTLWTPPEPPPADHVGDRRERARDAFPPLFACRPVVIGALWLEADYRLRRLFTIGEGKDEAGMLAEFAALMDKHRPQLVTWNGRGFDLPVLLLRTLALGLTWPWYYRDRDYRYRYSENGHFDLGDFLAEHGAARMTSLDGAARLIGLPGKGADGVDGSQVEALFQAGELEALRRYCLSDVAQTAFVFLRSRLLVGQLTRDEYRHAADGLLAALAADPRLQRLVGATDRNRLLLAG
jgi:predicted PolB exonuclease-like 3'-5' exonuclease